VTAAARGRRRLLPAAAVLVTVLGAVLGMVLASRHGTGASGSPAAGSRSPVPAATSGPAVPALPGVDLAGLRWSDYHGVELPSSAAAGPRDTAGGLASGYSDTPLGALIATVNIGVRANAQWGPSVYVPTIRDQVTGPDAAALLAGCQSGYSQAAQAAHVTGGGPLGNAYVTEEAFRWVAYTPADVTLDLVSAGPGSQGVTIMAVTRIEAVWSGGDWRVVAPPGGDWGNAAARLPSLSGYTVFPGQR
jgi:hypothetical protein